MFRSHPMAEKVQPAGDIFPQSTETSSSGVMLQLERISCPLCGSSDSSVVITSKDKLCGVPGEFHVERCHTCGHRFMNPRPAPESLAACYPPQYGPHQSVPKAAGDSARTSRSGTDTINNATVPDRPKYLRILPLRYVPGLKRFYNWLIDDRSQPVPIAPVRTLHATDSTPIESSRPEKPRALELGCATGQYLVRLRDTGWLATGIEPGERPASIAKAAGLDVRSGTLDDIQLQSEQFELAAAWMVIEHVPDAKQTLQSLHSLLIPGGTLLFSIPNAGCWEPRFFGKYWYVWELPRHLHHFTPSSIRKLLEECGFADITIIHQRNLSYVVGSLALWILARWPESRFGCWLLRYPDRPTTAMKLFLAPFAHVLAWMRQGGRLTIFARRRTPENGP